MTSPAGSVDDLARDLFLTGVESLTVYVGRAPLPEFFPLSIEQRSPRGIAELLDRRETNGEIVTHINLPRDAAPVYVAVLLRQSVVSQALLDPHEDTVTFDISKSFLENMGGTVSGVLAGNPRLVAPYVVLSDAHGHGSEAHTDAAGRFEFSATPPGLWKLVCGGEGLSQIRQVVRVEPGCNLDLGAIGLDAARVISGKVTVAGGAPTPAWIRWDEVRCDSCASETENRRSERAGEDGIFEIRDASSSDYFVRAIGAKGRMAAQARVSHKEHAILVLRKTAALFVRISFGEIEPHLLAIHDEQGVLALARELWNGWNYRFLLPVGGYSLRLLRDGALVWESTTSVLPGGCHISIS